MIPYTDFLYFGILLYVAVPSVIAGLFGSRARVMQVLIVASTALMLVFQYWNVRRLGGAEVRELWLVLGFGLYQFLLARGFLLVRSRTAARWPGYIALALAVAPLVAAKLGAFLPVEWTFGFIGISWISFRALEVVFNIQDGLIKSLSVFQYLSFLLFFPTISAGPVDRYKRFGQDWHHDRTRQDFLRDMDGAVQHFFRGLLYKFILAALIQQYWMDPVAKDSTWLGVASYMYAYSFYLFFDFAGYSAFAISISYLLGVHTPENFRRPFLSHNIREFWDRWNITLSWWFRDFVYMRFVLLATKRRWFSDRYVASYLGFFISFGLMGLWHGLAWHYIVYGLYHATLLVGHNVFTRVSKAHNWQLHGRAWQVASILITFQLVCFGLLIFSGRLGQ